MWVHIPFAAVETRFLPNKDAVWYSTERRIRALQERQGRKTPSVIGAAQDENGYSAIGQALDGMSATRKGPIINGLRETVTKKQRSLPRRPLLETAALNERGLRPSGSI